MDLSRLIYDARRQLDLEALADLSFEERSALLVSLLTTLIGLLSEDVDDGKITESQAEHWFTDYFVTLITRAWGSGNEFEKASDDYCAKNLRVDDAISRMQNIAKHFSRKTDDT